VVLKYRAYRDLQPWFENSFEYDEYLKKYEEKQFLILCIDDCSVFRLSAIDKLTLLTVGHEKFKKAVWKIPALGIWVC